MLKKILFKLLVFVILFILHDTLFIIPVSSQTNQWAFEETFTFSPRNPDGTFTPTDPRVSQNLLPKTFDFTATHRRDTGGQLIDRNFSTFPADHDTTCEFNGSTLQHQADTNHVSNGGNPDKSFYFCKDHMMSSMGHVSGYSVTNFWPRQEFDFTNGGVLEFDVNINGNPGRSWWEIMLTPRPQMKVGAAQDWLPIDETYPRERIVLTFSERQSRKIQVGTGQVAPDGWIAEGSDWREYGYQWLTNDPANTDRRIRRKNRITFSNNSIVWEVQKNDGTFDSIDIDIPSGLPFKRGLVMFKTHAYTPEKDGNMDKYTYHWDNIRFTGPKLLPYITYEAPGVINLEANGSVPIGSTQTNSITIDKVGTNPVLFGQVENPKKGQVLLSINGNPNMSIVPVDGLTCGASGFESFYVPINPSLLKVGANTFKWTVGPRPSCLESWEWDGFGVKGLEIQFDGELSTATPTPTPACAPRPECIDETPACNIPTPTQEWCPKVTGVASPTITPQAPSATNTPSPKKLGDVDGSGVVDIYDFNEVIRFFGTSQSNPYLDSDLDKSGEVDIYDFNEVVGNFDI